jgi:hypothetical protein
VKSSVRSTISTLAAGGLLCLGATPALGGTYTLNLSAPDAVDAGDTTIIQASGSNPPDDFFSSWLDMSAIPTSVLAACPADYLNANQIARSSSAQGGEVIINSQREDVDGSGNFSMPIAYSPTKPGGFHICGYTNDGATTTLATASLIMTVRGSSPGAKPANVRRPRVKRSGRKLVCSRGKWTNSPTGYSYSWRVNGKRKRGARGRTLAVTRKLRGREVQCTVKASNASGATKSTSRKVRVARPSG